MRLVDADALIENMEGHVTTMSVCLTTIEARAKSEMKRTCISDVANAPTIDAIPVEWLRQKAEENSHYAEPYFAFAYVLHEWQQTKSIEELQAESEMRDWKAEQELDT